MGALDPGIQPSTRTCWEIKSTAPKTSTWPQNAPGDGTLCERMCVTVAMGGGVKEDPEEDQDWGFHGN